MRINIAQRNMLIAASAVLSLLWLAEAGSGGMKHSHWIIVIPLIAALLFVAFSAKKDDVVESAAMPSPETPPPLTSKSIVLDRTKFDEGDAVVSVRYSECVRQWDSFIRASLVDRKPKATAQERADIKPLLDIAAAKMAFGSYVLVLLGRSPEAYKSADLTALRTQACARLGFRVQRSLEYLSSAVADMPQVPETCVEMAKQQLIEYEQAIVRVRKNLSAKAAFPIDPLFAALDNDTGFGVGTPEDRDLFYGIKYREETGRLLHPKPGIVA